MQKIKINLGCGEDIKKGWINVDVDTSNGAEVAWDLNNKPFPFKNNSVDLIYASCILEHIKNLGNFVDECYRILKKDGKIIVKTDHAGYIFLYLVKRLEHNRILQGNYSGSYWHKNYILKDNHNCLFVPSHLHILFNKFERRRITYPSPDRKAWKNFLMNLIPYKLGKQHIKLEAIK